MDAAIEYCGLLKASNLDAATRSGSHTLSHESAYLVGMVITFGYILTYAREGSLDGRYHPCQNRISAIQDADFAARDKTICANLVVKDALQAISDVQNLYRQKKVLEDRIAHEAAPFNTEIAALQSQKRLPQHELSLEARHRIQDAHDNWIGAHAQFMRHVTAMIATLEPMDTADIAMTRSPIARSSRRRRDGMGGWLRRCFRGRPAPSNGLEGSL